MMGSAVKKNTRITDQSDGEVVCSTVDSNDESTAARPCHLRCFNIYSTWLAFCSWLDSILGKLFGAMGQFISNRPFTIIVVAILFVGLCSIGFLWLNPENRASKLFVPQNSRAIQDLTKASKFFPLKLRQEEVILTPKQGQDVLGVKYLEEALQVHRVIENLTGYTDICSTRSGSKARSKEHCMAINPLELFAFRDSNFVNITRKISEALTCPGPIMSNGRPSCLNMPKMFAAISKNTSTNEVLTAQALKITYFVKEPNSDEERKRVKAWEELFVSKLLSFQDELSSVTLYISAERSLDDAISESSSSDIRWFALTFTVMLQFASLMVGKLFRNPLTGHSLLALGGTFSVGLGILAGFSLAMAIQTPFVTIVGVLPFLVIGIGLDDMFIIVDHLDRQERHLKVPMTVKKVMSGTGATITMTTLTDLVAFAVSTFSQFPSISYFCTYAALTISFAFLMIVTVFVALLSFDVRRIKANRRNCLPVCFAPDPKEGQPPWDEPRPQVSNRLMERWGKFLMWPKSKVMVIVISLGLLAAGIYATLHLDQEFDRSLLAKDDSYYKAFLKMERKYFKLPTEVSLILDGNVEYRKLSIQNEINQLSKVVAENNYYMEKSITWMGEFLKYCKDHNKTSDGDSFTSSLNSFLNTSQFSYFKEDIIFGPNESAIEATRIVGFMKSSNSSVFRKNAMLSIREDLASKSKLPVYTASASFIFVEQYAIILSETIRNLIVAALAILIVTAPFLVSLSVSLLVFFGFVSLIFELFGMMWLWGVSLNSISMINLVMAIGFAVDYSAHVAHAFVFGPDTSAEKRVIQALSQVGASVLLGGVSTLVGIGMTALSKSEIFQIFFKMFFSMIFLGLLHGLCFLPVYLAVFHKFTLFSHPSRSTKLCDSDPGVAKMQEVVVNPAVERESESNTVLKDDSSNLTSTDEQNVTNVKVIQFSSKTGVADTKEVIVNPAVEKELDDNHMEQSECKTVLKDDSLNLPLTGEQNVTVVKDIAKDEDASSLNDALACLDDALASHSGCASTGKTMEACREEESKEEHPGDLPWTSDTKV